MFLGIIGSGTMGAVLRDYAKEDGTFDEIVMLEPLSDQPWPEKRPDLLVDFSHPKAIGRIYDYCRKKGGNIPVVLASTGYGPEEEKLIQLLEKICPLVRSSNFSRGMEVMNRLCREAKKELGDQCDIRMTEAHHTKKQDRPSGTAVSLCRVLGLDPFDESQVQSLRMGSVCGQHTVYFALEDEILEIRHTAMSKKIFAIGALEAGKKLMKELT
ncbi:MAG: dihydrodipicolinate reductase C-terminal domain-containing protein [Firmicutes bacterium]|nr:dihydrodipicolinate reductase C-terminal domain-containing protein [Bacillota bacterium]